VLQRKEYPLVLCLFAGEHGGVLGGADRDIAAGSAAPASVSRVRSRTPR
jgi:hypothetical protein